MDETIPVSVTILFHFVSNCVITISGRKRILETQTMAIDCNKIRQNNNLIPCRMPNRSYHVVDQLIDPYCLVEKNHLAIRIVTQLSK